MLWFEQLLDIYKSLLPSHSFTTFHRLWASDLWALWAQYGTSSFCFLDGGAAPDEVPCLSIPSTKLSLRSSLSGSSSDKYLTASANSCQTHSVKGITGESLRFSSLFESECIARGVGFGAKKDHWWASSSDTLIYPSIFAFPSLSLHHQSTTTHLHSDVTARDHAHARTTIALASSDRSHLFDGHMTYDSHVFTPILSVSNVPPPAVQPIMSSHTVRSGTFYNFTLYLLSCFPFIFNLPVFTFRERTIIAEALTNCLYESPPELRFRTYASCLFRTISHRIALPRSHHQIGRASCRERV